ncbi:unnamed protein product [Prorocentrum cordatum]|uniref:Uncharacterized protein n=1 Tax=Prorocentrum cordatum TaxID=2364126 RepID=A0ABN9PAX8_9DINO|nr:unnamed protein product [Polarella glacialis]
MGEVPTALPGDGFCLPCSSSSLLAPALDGGPHEAGIKKEREHAGSNLRPSKIWERVTVTKMTASLSRCAPRRGARSSGPQQRRGTDPGPRCPLPRRAEAPRAGRGGGARAPGGGGV